jgi:hypothetical protein
MFLIAAIGVLAFTALAVSQRDRSPAPALAAEAGALS